MSGLTRRSVRFVGVNTNAKGNRETNHFRALANNDSIEAIEGYAIYARVKRPQRKSMTVLEGYEPMTIVVPLVFDESTAELVAETARWRGSKGTIEEDIQALEWMGGRGIRFKTPQEGGVATPGEGNSPLVTITSTDSDGTEKYLVPEQFQTKTLKWIVSAPSGSGIEWDKTVGSGVLRNDDGERIRQACTVTLTEYVQPVFDEGANSAAARSKARQKAEHEFSTVTIPVDGRYYSLGEIAAFYCASKSARSELVKGNESNRAIGSNPAKRLKRGTRVKIPQTALLQ